MWRRCTHTPTPANWELWEHTGGVLTWAYSMGIPGRLRGGGEVWVSHLEGRRALSNQEREYMEELCCQCARWALKCHLLSGVGPHWLLQLRGKFLVAWMSELSVVTEMPWWASMCHTQTFFGAPCTSQVCSEKCWRDRKSCSGSRADPHFLEDEPCSYVATFTLLKIICLLNQSYFTLQDVWKYRR